MIKYVHRLLADDRPDDHLVGGERHAYTSSRRARAGCSITIVSALSRSTTLSESASRTTTRARFRAERSRRSSRAGETIRTRPATLRLSRTPRRSLVRIASSPKASRTRIASPPSLAVSAPRSARRFILRGRRWAYERGWGPKTTPPPVKCGARREPWRARPVPFWRYGFLPPPATSPRVFVSLVPSRRPASCAVTTWCMTAALTGAAKSSSESSTVPIASPVRA
jgi:hypothetical protein